MTEPERLELSHLDLVALCVALMRVEESLDDRQKSLLELVREKLYAVLSVAEMERIEEYYEALSGL